jgi:NAD(P)-dependent dehydrogenase (short-subunit alcohol dehydrogenase family)
MTLALNHLAYFLLTNLLLDMVRASAPARIINVASEAHRGITLKFDDLQGRGKHSGLHAYGASKLGNLLFTFELARRLQGTGVTVNALHPGFVNTNIFANNGWLGWVVERLAGVMALSPEDGARTTLHLATSPEVSAVTGRYFIKERPASPSAASQDPEAARRLWEISAQLTGLQEAGA